MTFYFQVILHLGHKKFADMQIKNNLPNASEIVLTSNEYTDYDVCIKDLKIFMAEKAKSFQSKKEKFIIKWEKNPFVIEEEMNADEEEKQHERWFSNEVLKMFITTERAAKSGMPDESLLHASMFSDNTRVSERTTGSNSLH